MDENDELMAGTLPVDPMANTATMVDGPEIVTVAEGLHAAALRVMSTEKSRHISSGDPDLDRMTGGFRPGEVWVMGAETSWGKSSWLIALCDDAIKAGRRPLIVSVEDAASVYFDRLLVRRAKVNAQRFRNRELTREEMMAIDKVQRAGENQPLFLNAIDRSTEWVCGQIRAMVAEFGIDFVGVDYVQELRLDAKKQDRRLELAEVARLLRATIKECKITGCLFTQLTIPEGEMPGKYAVRDSKDVANGAEVIVMGWTPQENVESSTAGFIEAGTRCMRVAKAKSGQKGVVRLHWDDNSACFRRPPGEYDDMMEGFEETIR